MDIERREKTMIPDYNQRKDQCLALEEIGKIELFKGNYENAIVFLEAGKNLAKKIGWKDEVTSFALYLTETYILDSKEPEKIRENWEEVHREVRFLEKKLSDGIIETYQRVSRMIQDKRVQPTDQRMVEETYRNRPQRESLL